MQSNIDRRCLRTLKICNNTYLQIHLFDVSFAFEVQSFLDYQTFLECRRRYFMTGEAFRVGGESEIS